MLAARTTENRKHQTSNMLSTKIAAVAFDMDGLLLNTEDLYNDVGEILMQRRGKLYRDSVRKRMIGLPAPQAFGVLIEAESLTETWEELHDETLEIFEEILPFRLALMPGAKELLTLVEALNIPRCVATSSSREFAEKALQQVGVLSHLNFVLTAADVPRGKPYPDIYQESAKRMAIEVSSMLVLEDSPNGTRAGVTAGAYVVSVPNEHTAGGDFTGAQWIADTLQDERLYHLLPAPTS
jgi:HAD superfamily hydrolase (TIGR01509 family)